MKHLLSMVVLAFVAAGSLAACSGTDQYFRSRAADLGDIVRFQAIGSLGAAAKIEVTQFAAIGAGAYKGYSAGFANREFGAGRAGAVDLGWSPFLNVHRERDPGGDALMFSGSYDFVPLGEHGPEYEHDSALASDWASLRLTAVLFAGADVQLRLNQLYDCVAGVFGADPLSDDAIEASTWAG